MRLEVDPLFLSTDSHPMPADATTDLSTQGLKTISLSDYRPADFAIETTQLRFELIAQATRVTAILTLRRTGPANAPLALMGERLKLISVMIDGEILAAGDYRVDDEHLTIEGVPDAFTLETVVEIDPENNTALEGLYMSSGRFCSQCEAEGFRKVTYFFDRPDVLSTYRVRIEAPKTIPHLLSNGNLTAKGEAESREGQAWHFAEWHDPFPKPCYLFALVAGDLDMIEDSFVTASGRKVDLRIYVDTGMSGRALYAMDALKRSMKWDEEVYGREYDLDLFMIVAVRDFNFGAMENKGLNIFNASLLLAEPETATDLDYERIEGVIAHEYFHNWSGNRVTCRDWFQLCLKEGLTVFRDQGFSGDMRGKGVTRIKDVKTLRSRQFPEDQGPLSHPVRPSSFVKIDNFYTATVYEKGAEIVGMLKTYVGPALYRAALDRYFADNDGRAATLEDFLRAFEDVTGEDFSPWLQWYTQAGTPRLNITGTYEAQAKTLTLTLTQKTEATPGQADKSPLPLPVRLGLLTPDGHALNFVHQGQLTDEIVYVLRDAVAELTLSGVETAPALSALRHFSAPVILTLDEPEAHLMTRFIGDSDPLNRWEASQVLATRLILGTADAAGETAYAEALLRSLTEPGPDQAFKALLMGLPTESALSLRVNPVDPAVIHARRDAFRSGLSLAVRQPLRDMYDALSADRPAFSPDALSAGRRALRNALLELLCASYAVETSDKMRGDLEALAQTHYRTADNMTDTMAGLFALMSVHGPLYRDALSHFYDRFKHEPLVIDKWFSLQAQSAHPDTLEDVLRLSRHPDFDIKTPNRWRALVQNFASNNPSLLHRPDGAGYDFLIDQILKVDRINPSTAARLIEPLSGYQRFSDPCRSLMKTTLLKLLATEDLSKNVRELAEKAIG
jgi:aminopeptidase N